VLVFKLDENLSQIMKIYYELKEKAIVSDIKKIIQEKDATLMAKI